jgi:hypothetical protein
LGGVNSTEQVGVDKNGVSGNGFSGEEQTAPFRLKNFYAYQAPPNLCG